MKKHEGGARILLEGEGYEVTLAAGGIDGISLSTGTYLTW